MNRRHAAVLALMGWYLMVPPSGIDAPRGDPSAPLSSWTRLGAREYETRDACEEDLESEHERLRHLGARIAMQNMDAEQCVSADDPRLQKK